MSLLTLPQVSWTNGTIMIGVFAFVSIALVAAVFLLINSEKPKWY